MSKTADELKKQIFVLVRDYYNKFHKRLKNKKFQPGVDKINYAGRIFDDEELVNLVDASLDFWLTSGKYTETFEDDLSKFLGIKYSIFVNSGSSANLLAFMALTSSLLKDRSIKRGDEVITVAAGFPTTIAPIIQYGAVPIFVDISIPTYNIDVRYLEGALSKKTKAVFVAHTLGNPINIEYIKNFCEKHNLWFIEDNCDALGSMYFLDGKWRYTGTFGDIGTSSFYPPHHITTGEGGALYTNNPLLYKIILSLRDWGRDCWCKSGKDNTCGKRFSFKFGELPLGYDHKYVYSHFGYNLKATDLQAAIGVAQLKKLPQFIQNRIENWEYLYNGLKKYENYFILPEAEKNSKPSWFGFLLSVRDDAPFSRDEIVQYLELKGIQTRMLFAGNIIKHPCFDDLRKKQRGYKVYGELKNTDFVMKNSFWVGVYPGMDKEKLNYLIEIVEDFIGKHK
jgi:CDP-6-deoxy-D-xylo-4-hexulose-3-dehydrase